MAEQQQNNQNQVNANCSSEASHLPDNSYTMVKQSPSSANGKFKVINSLSANS